MNYLALSFVIVCRCGQVFDRATPACADLAYGYHVSPYEIAGIPVPEGMKPCPIGTEAWRGWSVKMVPPEEPAL